MILLLIPTRLEIAQDHWPDTVKYLGRNSSVGRTPGILDPCLTSVDSFRIHKFCPLEPGQTNGRFNPDQIPDLIMKI